MPLSCLRPIVLALIALTALSVAACAPKPPRGKPVQAPTMAAAEAPELPSKKEWYVWHQEGLRRLALGHKDEALYCFHVAREAWPKELPEAERGVRPPLLPAGFPIPEHRAAALETLLKLAEVYLQMNEPSWAVFYLDEFDRVMPGKESLTRSLRVQAMALQTPIVKGKQTPKQKTAKPTAG